jgi:hypothetical protein
MQYTSSSTSESLPLNRSYNSMNWHRAYSKSVVIQRIAEAGGPSPGKACSEALSDHPFLNMWYQGIRTELCTWKRRQERLTNGGMI